MLGYRRPDGFGREYAVHCEKSRPPKRTPSFAMHGPVHAGSALLPLESPPCYICAMTMQFQKKDPRATITTKFGEIRIKFYPDDAPRHVENFINLAKMGFYDDTTFHRVVPGFIIQGGDPLSKTSDRLSHGTGGPGYFLNPEPNDRPHKRGAISMAKMPRDGSSTRDFNDNGSQFFISLQDNGGLDRRYSIFGEIIRGIEIIDMIAKLPCDERDNPLEPIRMKVTVKE